MQGSEAPEGKWNKHASSLVYYVELAYCYVAQKKRCSFSVQNLPISWTELTNGVLIDQEWLLLGVALFCPWIKVFSRILTTVLTSVEMMTTSRNWLKDFSQRTPSYRTLIPENLQRVAKAHWDHMDESNLTIMSLLTNSRDRLCEELLCILRRKDNKL